LKSKKKEINVPFLCDVEARALKVEWVSKKINDKIT